VGRECDSIAAQLSSPGDGSREEHHVAVVRRMGTVHCSRWLY
jgi:hypothetical protein